jgi:hypothetical protein
MTITRVYNRPKLDRVIVMSITQRSYSGEADKAKMLALWFDEQVG